MKQKKIQVNTTKQWDTEYIMIHLDQEIYPSSEYGKTFIIFTKKELNKISKQTYKRMQEYNNIKPKNECGFDMQKQ